MNLHDEHLKKALEYSPDRDFKPNDQVRNAVLDYANHAVNTSKSSGFRYWLKDQFSNWQNSNWQWVGFGSLASILLVIIITWHEKPEDTIWVGSVSENVAKNTDIAPNKSENSTQKKLKQDSSIEPPFTQTPSQIEIARKTYNLNKMQTSRPQSSSSTVASTAQLNNTKIMDKVTHLDIAPTRELGRQNQDKTTLTTPDSENKNTSNLPVIAATAPIPIPETMDAMSDRFAKKDYRNDTSIAVDKESIKRGTSESSPAESNTKAKNELKHDDLAHNEMLGGNSGGAVSTDVRNDSLKQEISKIGGKAAAIKDIQTGILRLIRIEEQLAKGSSSAECIPTKQQSLNIDVQTGYKIVIIEICTNSTVLTEEVGNYNQTMQNNWYSKNVASPKQ